MHEETRQSLTEPGIDFHIDCMLKRENLEKKTKLKEKKTLSDQGYEKETAAEEGRKIKNQKLNSLSCVVLYMHGISGDMSVTIFMHVM